MFSMDNAGGSVEMMPGVMRKTLVHGEKTLLVELRIAEGGVVPLHQHPHEQTGVLVSGRLDFTVGDERVDVGPGQAWCIPGDVPHGVTALESCYVVEAFAPVREEYLP